MKHDEMRTTLKGMATREHDTIISRVTGKPCEIKFGPLPATMAGHTGSAGGLVPKNPFASQAQAGYMHSHPDILGEAGLKEWDKASKGKKLPKRVEKK